MSDVGPTSHCETLPFFKGYRSNEIEGVVKIALAVTNVIEAEGFHTVAALTTPLRRGHIDGRYDFGSPLCSRRTSMSSNGMGPSMTGRVCFCIWMASGRELDGDDIALCDSLRSPGPLIVPKG